MVVAMYLTLGEPIFTTAILCGYIALSNCIALFNWISLLDFIEFLVALFEGERKVLWYFLDNFIESFLFTSNNPVYAKHMLTWRYQLHYDWEYRGVDMI